MYVAENNMDFYKLLSDTENSNEKEDELCMISKNILTDTHIILECGHKFNYLPLLKDMYTRMYLSHDVKCLRGFPLNVNKIECPYCRRITNRILPFLKEEYDVKIYGLNSLIKDNMINEINIPFYDIYKCSVEDCHHYYYAGYLLPFCQNHVTNKPLIKKHKNEIKQQFLLENNMLCKVVLKSGNRKGEQCKQQCEIGGICKRHKGNTI